jgi:uncharacterized repeat protein (TIGR03803 family)
MKSFVSTFVVAAAAVLCIASVTVAGAQVYKVIHHFGDPGIASDGRYPFGEVVSDGSKLYGMASNGGAFGTGIIFSMNSDASGYTKLHDFPDPSVVADGVLPYGSLVLNGGVLYGMAVAGGTNGGGVIFSINSDGTGYTKLHNFPEPAVANDGLNPYGTLVMENGVLYGTTWVGGAYGGGVIFSINADGSGYTKLHDFLDPTVVSDGILPWAGPVIAGGILYGTTSAGGSNGVGTVYSIAKDGSGYTKLHEFPDPAVTSDGSALYGPVTVENGTIYGTAFSGGAGWDGTNNNGIVFSMNTDGSGYSILHDFSTGGSDGANPYGGVILGGDKLYGMTTSGGAFGASPGLGALYSINTDGSGFTIEHSFAGSPFDGSGPLGNLTLQGSTIYGMTISGGAYGPGYGVVFSYDVPALAPLIDLSVNKHTFSTTDRLTATADVAATGTAFRPYVQLIRPGGIVGYFVRDKGLVSTKTQYVGSGPFLLGNPISNYPVLDVGFSNVAPGDYTLSAYGEDIFGEVIGSVDRESLVVQ